RRAHCADRERQGLGFRAGVGAWTASSHAETRRSREAVSFRARLVRLSARRTIPLLLLTTEYDACSAGIADPHPEPATQRLRLRTPATCMLYEEGPMVEEGGGSSIASRSRDRRRARAPLPSKRDKPEQMRGEKPRNYKAGLHTRNRGR